MARSEIESALAAAIASDPGDPGHDGTPKQPSDFAREMASLAFRRWSSFARRHKKTKHPTFEDRVVDLEKGLRSHYEPDIPYEPPGEWMRVARFLAAILAGPQT